MHLKLLSLYAMSENIKNSTYTIFLRSYFVINAYVEFHMFQIKQVIFHVKIY